MNTTYTRTFTADEEDVVTHALLVYRTLATTSDERRRIADGILRDGWVKQQ